MRFQAFGVPSRFGWQPLQVGFYIPPGWTYVDMTEARSEQSRKDKPLTAPPRTHAEAERTVQSRRASKSRLRQEGWPWHHPGRDDHAAQPPAPGGPGRVVSIRSVFSSRSSAAGLLVGGIAGAHHAGHDLSPQLDRRARSASVARRRGGSPSARQRAGYRQRRAAWAATRHLPAARQVQEFCQVLPPGPTMLCSPAHSPGATWCELPLLCQTPP